MLSIKCAPIPGSKRSAEWEEERRSGDMRTNEPSPPPEPPTMEPQHDRGMVTTRQPDGHGSDSGRKMAREVGLLKLLKLRAAG